MTPLPGIEPWVTRVTGGYTHHYTTKTWWILKKKLLLFVRMFHTHLRTCWTSTRTSIALFFLFHPHLFCFLPYLTPRKQLHYPIHYLFAFDFHRFSWALFAFKTFKVSGFFLFFCFPIEKQIRTENKAEIRVGKLSFWIQLSCYFIDNPKDILKKTIERSEIIEILY